MSFWWIDTFEFREAVLDFTSSGQSRCKVHQVVCENVLLINATELLEFEGDSVQVGVCESCGVTGCVPGSWVKVGTIGANVLFCPAIRKMREGDWQSKAYSPPNYLTTRGIPVIPESVYRQIRALAPRLPRYETLHSCSNHDVLGLLQLNAPGQLLGTLGKKPTVSRDSLIAVSHGDLETEINTFESLVDVAYNAGNQGCFGRPSKYVTFYSNLPGFPEWSPFGYIDGNPILGLGDPF
jgi:hypothetical protein